MKRRQPEIRDAAALMAVEVKAYSVADFMVAYDIGRATLYSEIANGRLKSYRLGRRRLISRQAAEEWQRSLEEEPAAREVLAETLGYKPLPDAPKTIRMILCPTNLPPETLDSMRKMLAKFGAEMDIGASIEQVAPPVQSVTVE